MLNESIAQDTIINSDKIINKKLIECEMLNESIAQDTIIKSDKIISESLIECKINSDNNISENLIECDVLNKTTEDHTNATTKECIIDENTAKDVLKIMTINAILSTSEEDKMPDPTTAPTNPHNSAIRSIKNNLKDIGEMKSFRKKKVFIREGAILPDIIRLGSYIECSRLPAKTFSSRCKELYKECKPVSYTHLRAHET